MDDSLSMVASVNFTTLPGSGLFSATVSLEEELFPTVGSVDVTALLAGSGVFSGTPVLLPLEDYLVTGAPADFTALAGCGIFSATIIILLLEDSLVTGAPADFTELAGCRICSGMIISVEIKVLSPDVGMWLNSLLCHKAIAHKAATRRWR